MIFDIEDGSFALIIATDSCEATKFTFQVSNDKIIPTFSECSFLKKDRAVKDIDSINARYLIDVCCLDFSEHGDYMDLYVRLSKTFSSNIPLLEMHCIIYSYVDENRLTAYENFSQLFAYKWEEVNKEGVIILNISE